MYERVKRELEDALRRAGVQGPKVTIIGEDQGGNEMIAEFEEILTDRWSRQRAEEALMEKYRLCDRGCGQQCQEATETAREMVDTVIEAWRGR